MGARDLRPLWGVNTTCQPLPFLSYKQKGERRSNSSTRANVDNNPSAVPGWARSVEIQESRSAGPGPSWTTERKERDDRVRVPRPVSTTAPETHGPCSSPPVAKSLVYGPGPGSSWGDRASSPTRFNTYSRGSTHLGVARPGPGFFLSFKSLKPGRWVLEPGLAGTQDSRLGK